MDDKLEFSAKNLGSLAAFMNRHDSVGHPLHLVMDWLRLYSANDDQLTQITEEVILGYGEENDLPH